MSDAPVRIVVGPLGSAKTFAMIMECLRRSVQQEPDSNGVRRTRCAIVRQTRPQIVSTILPEINQIIGQIIIYRPSKTALYLDLNLDDGTRVESEWLLMPLLEEADQKRLLSLNLTWIWVSEVRELNYDLVQSIRGRAGRFPSQATTPPTWYGLFGESNPWSVSSKWHTHLVTSRPDNWDLFRQPGGLDENAENIQNLPGGRNYYHELMRGSAPEWQDVHIHAKFGADLAGTPVYRTTFSPDFHTSPSPLQVLPQTRLLIFQDFGRTPFALIAQTTADTRLLVLAETYGENMGLEYFVSHQLTPLLNTERFAGIERQVIADPAGAFGEQGTEDTLFDIYERLGYNVLPAPTNELEPRIRAVEAALLQQRNGRPVILIDRLNCPVLCQAMEFGYKFARKTSGQIEDKPSKSHPDSDAADALGYGVLFTMGTQYDFQTHGRNIGRGKRGKPLIKRRFTSAAWT